MSSPDEISSNFTSSFPEAKDVAKHDLRNITIGQMIIYMTIGLVGLVLIYASLIICRRTLTTKTVKKLAKNLRSPSSLREIIGNPLTIQIPDSRSDLEWDMEGLQLVTTTHPRYLEECSKLT